MPPFNLFKSKISHRNRNDEIEEQFAKGISIKSQPFLFRYTSKVDGEFLNNSGYNLNYEYTPCSENLRFNWFLQFYDREDTKEYCVFLKEQVTEIFAFIYMILFKNIFIL